MRVQSKKSTVPPPVPPRPKSTWQRDLPSDAAPNFKMATREGEAAKQELRLFYLLAYNAGMAFGWLSVLFAVMYAAAVNQPPQELYAVVAWKPVGLLVAVSFVEIVHSALGLVKGGVVEALFQCVGRAVVYFGVATTQEAAQRSWWLPALLCCWSLSECIRYPYYMSASLNNAPGWLTWLRYSAFVVLYPAGFVSEVAVVVVGGVTVSHNLWLPALLPSVASNAQAVLVLYSIFAYVVGAPRLYFHMLRQRSKRLKGKSQ